MIGILVEICIVPLLAIGLPPPVIPGFNGNDVSSYIDARLDLDPVSELFASPGQLVNIIFLLANLGEARFFFVSVSEQNSGFFPDSGVGRIHFRN